MLTVAILMGLGITTTAIIDDKDFTADVAAQKTPKEKEQDRKWNNSNTRNVITGLLQTLIG